MDLSRATIVEAGREMASGRLSPVELVEATLRRIERLNPTLKAFLTVSGDIGMERARQAQSEIASGRYRGPLHGIPYSLKDVIATKDVRTTFGHPRLIDFQPDEDATVRRLLDEAGAILVGKVYSQIGRGDSIVDCCNPWDVTRSPGTSSSGSGSAVAAGLGLLSIGTDTGGSVRHPASSCNLVGIRATFGRISRHGVLAPSWSHDQAGPLTRTVADNALVMETLAQYDALDPVSVERPAEKFLELMEGDVKGLRIGVPTDRWLWEREAEEVEELVRTAIGVLEELGATVREVSLPLASENRAVHFKLSQPEAYVYWTSFFGEEVVEKWEEIRPGIVAGKRQPFSVYMEGQQEAARIRQEVEAAMSEVDVIATPTGSTLGDKCDASTAMIRGREVPARSRAVYINGIASLMGMPAISVPCGFALGDRMPVGLQLMGPKFSEGLLYRAANAYQQATEWHGRGPDIESQLGTLIKW